MIALSITLGDLQGHLIYWKSRNISVKLSQTAIKCHIWFSK